MGNAIGLIHFEAMGADENLASTNGREQIWRQVTGVAGTIGIEDFDGADRTSDGLGASAEKPTRHEFS
jgi:hypothetical protein